MNDKMARLQRLLADGYVVEDIHSDAGTIEAVLRQGSRRMTIRFLPSEAHQLLYRR